MIEETTNPTEKTKFSRNDIWKDTLKRTVEFIDSFGHPPRAAGGDQMETFLGVWCARQRRAYRLGTMNKIRREAIEKYGIHEHGKMSDFFTRLDQYKAFILNKGRIPSQTSTDKFEKSLFYWREDQKSLHNHGKIKSDRLEVLLQSEVLESGYDYEWRSYYGRLKIFIATHGYLPLRSSQDPEESQLGRWRQAQYGRYKNGKLNKNRAMLLEEIGLNITVDDVNWNSTFQLLKDFIKKYGLIPSRRSDLLGERSLYQWLRVQRRYLKSNKLSSRRKALLNTLEIPRKGRLDVRWDEIRKNVQAFVSYHGRLPSRSATNKKERSLGIWCHRQRCLYQLGKLSPERITPAEDLGIFSTRLYACPPHVDS